MTVLSDRFKQIALQLVKRFGKECVIRKVYTIENPDDPTSNNIEYKDFVVNAAITEFEKDQVDGVQVLRGDKQIIVSKTGDCPNSINPGDFFIDGQYTYKIIPNVEIYGVNGIVVAYLLQGRM